MAEGLDRHDALHAIGMELAVHMNDLVRKGEAGADPNQPYYDALERLTAEGWRRSADEQDEEPTEADANSRRIGRFRAHCRSRRSTPPGRTANIMTPVFRGSDRPTTGRPSVSPTVQNALFFIFHLLGEWREKSAYRPLAKLLRRPADEIDAIFGGATTETSHRVMAAVFDGDPQPLYDVILEPEADEFVRSRMCETLAMLTLAR